MTKVYGYDTNIYETSIGNIKSMNEEINCVYSSNGVTTMSTKQYDNYLDIIHDLKKENEQLKKQKDDVVEYIKSLRIYGLRSGKMLVTKILNKILRMLGEIDNE